MNNPRPLQLLGTGVALPALCVTAEDIDRRLGRPAGWSFERSGVRTRYFSGGETASDLGARAARAALDQAGLALVDIDLVISACGTPQQPIPCNAALLLEALGDSGRGRACFDVNATCASFIAALDVAAAFLATGRHRRILIVSSELSSAGLNWREEESSLILGDGAAAVVLAAAPRHTHAALLAARVETYPEGAHLTEIQGGGSARPAHRWTQASAERFLFSMQGKQVFKLASSLLPDFYARLLADAGLGPDEVSFLIPHQASPAAVRLLGRKLGFSDRLIDITETHANTIAASIPMALHFARERGLVSSGETIALLGTAAGFTLAGAVLTL